jgi:hypothetical protein
MIFRRQSLLVCIASMLLSYSLEHQGPFLESDLFLPVCRRNHRQTVLRQPVRCFGEFLGAKIYFPLADFSFAIRYSMYSFMVRFVA